MVIDTLNVDFFCVQELITKSISTVEYSPRWNRKRSMLHLRKCTNVERLKVRCRDHDEDELCFLTVFGGRNVKSHSTGSRTDTVLL